MKAVARMSRGVERVRVEVYPRGLGLREEVDLRPAQPS